MKTIVDNLSSDDIVNFDFYAKPLFGSAPLTVTLYPTINNEDVIIKDVLGDDSNDTIIDNLV